MPHIHSSAMGTFSFHGHVLLPHMHTSATPSSHHKSHATLLSIRPLPYLGVSNPSLVVSLGFTGLLLYLPKPKNGTFLPLRQPLAASTSSNSDQIPLLPALTTYQAHLTLMNVLAILAVDFPVFPRSLVKCETFGVSLV